jgi:hypothetical protein
MRSLARWLALLGATSACFAAAFPGSAAASTHAQQLLEKYQPVTVMDTNESFVPTTVEAFVADADLETQTAPNTWTVVSSSPSATALPTTPTAACIAQALVPCYRLNQHDCTPATGVASVSCYRNDWLSPSPQSVVYGRITSAGRTKILQYWYFSYSDFYSYDYPPDDFIWQAHEGDWEAVTILIRHGAAHPRWIGYSQHCTGERRSWRHTPRWHGSTHPVVDVGIGSHLNFFSTGDHPIAVQCIPPQAVAFLQAQGLALPVDHSHAGQAYGPAGAAGVTPTSVARITATRPEWMHFAGTWGEYQFFHGPNPINTVVSGFSPPSPPAAGLWQHPVQTILSWPRTG